MQPMDIYTKRVSHCHVKQNGYRIVTLNRTGIVLQDEQRHAIEQKLEDRARAEKDEIRKEREGLFQERKKQQQKLRRLEHKMELVQSVSIKGCTDGRLQKVCVAVKFQGT